MNCKNCQTSLSEDQKFCPSCGAKIITERITLRGLFSDFWENVMGWDNKYFTTFKMMLLRPEVVLKEYLNGTRKKYAAPLTAFAIAAAIAMVVFNQFTDHYLKIANQSSSLQLHIDTTEFVAPVDTAYNELLTTPEQRAERLEEIEKKRQTHLEGIERAKKIHALSLRIQKAVVKYYNIIAFFNLPFFAFIAFCVYRKPYNYAEHMVINVFIQTISLLIGAVMFLLSICIHPAIFAFATLITVVLYLYTYGRLYGHGFGQSLLKLLKFLLVMLLLLASFIVVVVIMTMIVVYFLKL